MPFSESNSDNGHNTFSGLTTGQYNASPSNLTGIRRAIGNNFSIPSLSNNSLPPFDLSAFKFNEQILDNSFTRKLNLFPIRLDSNDQSNAKQSKLFGAEKSDIGITRFTNDLFLPKDGYSLLQTPTESIPTVHPNVGSIISGQNSWSQAFLANYPPDKSYLGTISTLGNSEGSTVPLRNLSALKSHELPLTPIAGAKAGNNLFEVYTENATQPFLRANQNLESYRKGDSAPLRKSDRREQKVDFIGELLGFVVALGIVLLVFAIVADALIGVINDALALMTAFATSNIIGIVITGVVINLFTDGLKHLLKLWNQGKS